MKKNNSRTKKREKFLNLFLKKFAVYMIAGIIAAAAFSFAAVLYVRQVAETEMNQLLKDTKEKIELNYQNHYHYSSDSAGNRMKLLMISDSELFRINGDLGFYPLFRGCRDASLIIYDAENSSIVEDSEYTAVMTARMPKVRQGFTEYSNDDKSENKEIEYEMKPLENDQFRSPEDFETVIFRLDPDVADEFKNIADSARGFLDEIVCDKVYIDMDRLLFRPADIKILKDDKSGKIVREENFAQNIPAGFVLRQTEEINGYILEMGNDRESEVLKSVRNLSETVDFKVHSSEFARQYDWNRKASGKFENSEKFMLNGKEYYLLSVFTYDYSDVYLFVFAGALVVCVITALIRSHVQFAGLRALYFTEDYRREMTNTLAHDLKSPLMAVSGYAENLRSGKSPEKNEHYIDSIMQNVEYMDGIIQNVLELAKLEDGNVKRDKEETELSELTEKLLTKYETETKERNILVNINGTMKISADREMISHALENLLSNAVKYSSDNGHIDISFEKNSFAFENDFKGTLNLKSDELVKPFVRGDENRTGKKGSGLGLTIAVRILEEHGFKMSVDLKNEKFSVRAERKKEFKNKC